ncbi:MAG: hypothetical protein ACKOU6_14335, partial [Planctomycetota bacterium]
MPFLPPPYLTRRSFHGPRFLLFLAVLLAWLVSAVQIESPSRNKTRFVPAARPVLAAEPPVSATTPVNVPVNTAVNVPPQWNTDIAALLKARCVKCHG